MAFANGTTTLHLPIAASAGASLWGTDVRKLNITGDGTADNTTVCNLGTGGTVRRTCDPYTTTTADLAEADYGWAIAPSDMGSVTSAKRFYPAGDHVLNGRTNASVPFVSEAKDLIFSAFRVGPAPGRTRTLLGSATGAMNLAGGAIVLPLALPEIVFEDDETIQYSFEMNAGGVVVTGRTVQFQVGLTAVGQSRIETPSLGTLAEGSASFTGDGDMAAISGNVLATTAVLTGDGTLAAVGGSTAQATAAMDGSGELAALGASVASTTAAFTGDGDMAALGARVIGGTATLGDEGGGGDTFIRPVLVFEGD